MASKTCTKCGETKPLEDFTPSRRCKDGYLGQCKVCRNSANREQYARDLEHNRTLKREAGRRDDPAAKRERVRRHRARNPELARQRSTDSSRRLRERDPDYHRRWYWANVEKERARSREDQRRWRAEHPDGERARKQRYRQAHLEEVRQRERENTHRRRALMRDSSPELAEHMTRLLEEPCDYCGTTENITIDHIIPLSRGGKHEPANLAPACVTCNCSKGAKTLEEWNSAPLAA